MTYHADEEQDREIDHRLGHQAPFKIFDARFHVHHGKQPVDGVGKCELETEPRLHERINILVAQQIVEQQDADDCECAPELADIPARAVEADDERQEIETQRHNPHERGDGNVLADVVGDRQEGDRSDRWEHDPCGTLPKLARRLHACLRSIAGGLWHGGRCCGRACIGLRHARDRNRETARQKREEAKPNRPANPLSDDRELRFDQKGIRQERAERADIRERIQPVGRCAGSCASNPGLHEWSGRGEQKIGEPDFGKEQKQNP